MRLGIFVGSFNPVHKGHIYLANELINKNYLDKIFVIPTMPYWDKKMIDLKDRINMLKFYETDKIIVDDKNNYIKYTYEIMNLYHEKYPNDDIKLIIGADNLKDLDKWMNVDKILEYGVIVVGRDNINTRLFNYKNVIYTDIKPYKASSTEVRKDKSKRDKYLDLEVLNYIDKNNLYNE